MANNTNRIVLFTILISLAVLYVAFGRIRASRLFQLSLFPVFLPELFHQTTVFSNRAASRQFAAWLAVFNSNNKTALLSYHAAHFPYDVASRVVGDVNRELLLYNATGGFGVFKVVTESDSAISVILSELKRPNFARAIMEVNLGFDDHPVSKFDIHPTHTPLERAPPDRKKEFQKALAPLDSSKRSCIVKAISGVLEQKYVSPEKGARMIGAILAKLHEGTYDNYTDSEEFAAILQHDLQSVSGDKHLAIAFLEPPPDHSDDDPEKTPGKLFDVFKTMGFGFGDRRIERMKEKTIGFLPINGFFPCTPEAASDYGLIQQTISNILSELSEADALVVDLRTNGGGDPATVSFMLAYLLDEDEVPLNDMVDRNGTTQMSFSTFPKGELPKNASFFGGTKPLFVLTSKETISGGEEMAYDLQALKRANATIGEDATTAGAAFMPQGLDFICEDEFGPRWWVALIPSLRPVNHVTGGDWEGIGVRSDIVVKPGEDAEEVAKQLARKALGLLAEESGEL